ncbi:MAG: SGNH/GDSL hydrolase family protein [Planctomycetes bacterium]|nr:SGNH/GDSL hydrolase family protein [Planctomycetota bacterium]
MKHVACCIILLLCITSSAFAVDGEPAAIPECNVRNGLPNFYSKLKSGEKVTIAYFGGSITAQPGYRVKSAEWLHTRYPKASIVEVNAAIGGTGSDLGVYRMDDDVLINKPDMLFVEFAVNDAHSSEESVVHAMEGIVRKAIRAIPDIDICFVYTFTQEQYDTLANNRLFSSIKAMEKVASHYGISSIHLWKEPVAMTKAGKLILKAPQAKVEAVAGKSLDGLKAEDDNGAETPMPFSKDGTHPYINTGHKLYTNAIKRSLPMLDIGTPAPHTLPEAIIVPTLEKCKIYGIKQSMLDGFWAEVNKGDDRSGFLERFKSMWLSESPGASISFKVMARACYIYDILGPDCAKVQIYIDGEPAEMLDRFDRFCTFSRIATLKVFRNSKNIEEHAVKIVIQKERPARRKILGPYRSRELDSNPGKFDGTKWFIGGILLDGEIIE